jgi:hypothetical protein
MSDAQALIVAYIAAGATRLIWDRSQPTWNRPSYWRSANLLTYALVGLTWLPWTFYLIYMDLTRVKDFRAETKRHCAIMWLAFVVTALAAAAF